mmetsp:Transcript_16008/g.39204  ORF Transcript_16008/g.39204 Transcript_16008/m.39204 type:complete len:152 (+) Transcript_16008:296-751(+)
MNRWGDLHYLPEQQQLRQEQTEREKETTKTASNHRFKASRFNDRPLPSSVIGNGHVAMLRQNSLERHFLAVAAKEEEGEATVSLQTVPEDESLNAPHVALTSLKRKRQKIGKKETESRKEDRDESSRGTTQGKSDNNGREAVKKQSNPSME